MNCKPGDLAITVSTRADGKRSPGVVGRTVEVVRRATIGDVFLAVDGTRIRWVNDVAAWVVRSHRPLPWLIDQGPHEGRVFFLVERAIPDANLRPISGVPVHDEQHDEVSA